MSKYTITGKDGTPKAETGILSYHGEFMGESYVTTDVSSAEPVDWQIGDTVVYRGESYRLLNTPSAKKQARRESSGEAFLYENVRFDGLEADLTDTQMRDIVPRDNKAHYTGMAKFTFYGGLEALAERIQAVLDMRYWGNEQWTIKIADGYKSDVGDTTISFSDQTVWDALTECYNTFGAMFMRRGRTITIGRSGEVVPGVLRYGKGEGLKGLQRTVDTGQQVVTRLRAYGNTTNIPQRYYLDAKIHVVAVVTDKVGPVEMDSRQWGIIATNLSYSSLYFTTPIEIGSGVTDYLVTIAYGGKEIYGEVFKGNEGQASISIKGPDANNDNTAESVKAFFATITKGIEIEFTSGVNKDKVGADHLRVEDTGIPNNMETLNLMLPGFPKKSLKEMYPDEKRVDLSEDRWDPWIGSKNASTIGIKEGTRTFDSDEPGKNKDIYPTIKGVTADELRASGYEVTLPEGDNGRMDQMALDARNTLPPYEITDDGIFDVGEKVGGIYLTLKPIPDLKKLSMVYGKLTVRMTTGGCAGRDFDISYVMENAGQWKLKTNRVKDESLGIYYPNANFPIKAGDEFVLLDIPLPDFYVSSAARKLYEAAIEWLAKNDHTQPTYTPELDAIYINSHPEIRKNLIAGNLLQFDDKDLGIGGSVIINSLTIDEGKDDVPTYQLTLRDDKEDTLLGRIQSQIDSLAGGGSGGGYDLEQIRNLINAWGSDYFIRKDRGDTAVGPVTFENGTVYGDYVKTERGGYVDGQGNAEYGSVVTREEMRSPRFVDGFNGEGWRLWTDGGDGLARLTLDELTVRKTMRIFELLIEKIRSVGGVIVVSAANGKVKTVEENGESYVLTFEAATGFVKGDLMRCQTFKRNTMKLKGYWVTVAAASADGLTVTVAKSEFAGVVPEAGDECVLMGNTTNEKRQNMVMISATEDGQPRVDVMNGIRAKNFNGALRARLGNLDGIRDDYFPADNQPHGDGLYADNAYIHGTFILANGGDVNVLLQVLQNKIESAITSKRQDDISGSYLRNAAFGDGMRYWTYENNRQPYVTNKRDGGTVNTDGGFLTSALTSGTEAAVVGVKTCAHMVQPGGVNCYISQKAEDMQNLPALSEYPYVSDEEAEKGDKGMRKPLMTYLSFRVKCVKDSKFSVLLLQGTAENIETPAAWAKQWTLKASEEFQTLTYSGLWNGAGVFGVYLAEGEIYITDLVLNRDQVDVQYRTLFEQTDKFLKWAAMKLDKNGNVLSSSQILTKAEFNEISSSKFNETTGQLENQSKLITEADGAKLVSKAINEKELVTQSEMSVYVQKDGDGYISNAKIKADRISLEGYTTINEFFKIDEDGKMWATDGTFSGGITATSGTIGGFEINNTSFGANNIKTSQGNASVNIDPRRISFSLISEDRARTAYIGTYSITEGGADSMLRLTDTGGGVEGGLQGITKKAVMTFDVSGASDINCAFRGKGSGVLNGMICGYGVGDIDIMGGKQHPLVKDGDTIILTNDTPNTVVLPALTEMQKSLGIDDGSSFNFKIYLINNSGGTLTLKGNRQDGGAPIDKTRPNMYGLQLLNGYCYAILLVYDGNDYRGYTLGGN